MTPRPMVRAVQRGAVLFSAFATLGVAAAMPANAQSGRSQGLPLLENARPLADTRPPVTLPTVPDARATTATARLVVDAAPESFRVVHVDIPQAMLDDSDVRYQIFPRNVRLLSARTGVLPGARGGGLVFSVKLPATAQAGLAPLAEVVFTSRQRVVTTSVDVNVAARWRTMLSATRAVHGARFGQHVDVSFGVVNGGNAIDTLDLEFVAPPGWHMDGARRRIVLGAGDAAVESVRVRAPDGLTSGEAPIALIALAAGVERTRTHSTVRVAAPDAPRQGRGSVLTSFTMVTDRSGNVQTGVGVDGVAALTPTVELSVRVAGSLNASTAASVSMSQLNASSNAVTLSSPRWMVQAGAVGTVASDLTGQLLAGSGGAVQYKSDRVLFRAMAARPWHGDAANARSALGYASAELHRRDIVGYLSLAHIDVRGYAPRRLDAVALGAWYEPRASVRVATEVADRTYVGGRGIGYSALASATRPGSDFSLRFVNAPGGSAASAQGTQSAYLHAAHALTSRFRVAMDGWIASDSSDVAATRSTGWSLAPNVTFSPRLSGGVDVRAIGFESGRLGASMSSMQRQGRVHARSTLGPVRLGIELMRLAEDRGYSVAGVPLRDAAARQIVRGDAAYGGAFGSIRLAHTRTSASGWMPAQRAVALMVDQLHPIPALPTLTVQASAERVRIGDQSLASLRAALAVTLARGTQLQLGIEQNGALRSVGGASQRYLFMRLAKATGLTVPSSLWSHTGIVFQDLNGNGERDLGEPGFAGLVVRRGTESVVTDVDGRFELPQDFPGTVAVDERSLPMGWIMRRSPSRGATGRREIAVVPTGRVEVAITLQVDADVIRLVRMGAVSVVMTDMSGRSWLARAADDNRAVFDALPIGRYSVRGEASGASEPLIVTGPQTVDVRGDQPQQRLSLVASIRPLRVFQKPREGTP